MTSSSPITIGSDDDCQYISESSSSSKEIDLSHLPPVFVLPTRLADVTLHSLEQSLLSFNAPLTYNLSEAVLFIADINTARRCEVELRGKGVWTERIEREQVWEDTHNVDREAQGLQRGEAIKVVKIKWLTDLLESRKDVGMEKYVVYVGRKVPPPPPLSSTSEVEDGEPVKKKVKLEEGDDSKNIQNPKSLGAGILERAKLDAQEALEAKRKTGGRHYHRGTGLGGSHYGRSNRHGPADGGETAKISHQAPAGGIPSLGRKSTQEWENEQELSRTRPMPEWVKKKLKYSCERTTPLKTPNDHFISLLQVIKLSRTLSLDPIGIRAYSTAIASIAAYPYPLLSSSEVSQLPGCDGKIAGLFYEYIHSTPVPSSQPDLNRTLQVVQDLETSEEFTTLRTFWKIWGVGVVTAREFYFEKGWRDLDDVVEFGWSRLSRVQQIGVKYYDEFNDIRISRDEVERIANLIITAARTVGGKEWDGLVCGGYRRGKDWSGDVDIVLSHPDESLFENNPGGKGGAAVEWVSRIVSELETGGWVTHTLYLGRGGGFGSQKIDPTTNTFTHSTTLHDKDTLSKAMIVWQEQEAPHPDYPQWPGEGIKNPYPHRRVDIIVAPSSTAATAILGWTGATTFERDLRRFVEREYGWKFDSGGVWDRRTGERIEGLGGWKRGETLEESEKRLLEGLGVGWKEPWLRNTG